MPRVSLRIERAIRSGNSVERWHTRGWPVKQSVAAHSWGVVMLLLEEAPAEILTPDFLRVAALHDLHESVLGDLPAPAKGLYDEIRQAFAAAEKHVDKRLFDFDRGGLTEEQEKWLLWADRMEAYLWVSWVKDTFGFPGASRLLDQIMCSGLKKPEKGVAAGKCLP